MLYTRFIRFCIQYASVTLLYYDYILTFSREVKQFWCRKFAISTVLYWCCRYAMVANVIYTLALAEKLPTLSCDTGYQICATLSVIGRAAILLVWGARTYAVCNKSKVVLLLFGCLGLFIVVLSTIHIFYIACNGSKGKPPSDITSLLRRIRKYTDIGPVPGVTNILTLVYEVLSAVLTTIQCIRSLSFSGSPWKAQRQGLTYLVMQQGLLYFGFVSLFTIAAVILQTKAPNGSFINRLINALTLPISGQMTARFLIHLREWTPHDADSSSLNELFQDTRVASADDGPIEFRSITPRNRDGEEDNAISGNWATSKIANLSTGDSHVRRRPSAESFALRNKRAIRVRAECEDDVQTQVDRPGSRRGGT